MQVLLRKTCRTLRLPFVALLVSAGVLALAAACGGAPASSSQQAGTPTLAAGESTARATQPARREAVNESGTPIHAAGTVNVTPLPNQIGDCVLGPGTDCEGADLSNVDLSPARANAWSRSAYADLSEANLRGVNFTGANLVESDLTGADLRNARLVDVMLRDGTLYKADLRGADLTGADLTFVDMEDALTDGAIFCRTKMPTGATNNSGCP